MSWQYDPASLVPMLAALVALVLTLYSLGQYRRKVPGALAVTVMLAAAAIWTFGNALQMMATGSASQWLAIQVRTLGTSAVPVTLLILALTYADPRHQPRWSRWLPLLIVPAVTVVLGWTNGVHGLMWRTTMFEVGTSATEIYGSFGVARWVNLGYNYLMVIAAVLVLLRLRRTSDTRLITRIRVNAVLGAVGLTLAANLAYRFRPDLLPVDLTPIMFVVMGLVLSSRVLQLSQMRLVRLAQQNTASAVPAPIIVLDESDRLVDLNPAAQKQFDLTPAASIGMPLSQLIGNPILIDKALKRSLHEPVEVTLMTFGIERIFLLRSSPLATSETVTHGRVTVWNDITSWRQAEQALQENESFLRQVIDNNPHHIAVRHREGRYLLVNKAKAAFHGLATEAFVGESAHLLLNDRQQADAETQTDLEVMASDKIKHYPATAITNAVTGETHWFEKTVAPIKAVDGSPLGVLSVATDITSQKRSEQHVARQVRFEQLINRISGEFINQESSSFEATITTALGAIATFVEADRGAIMELDDTQRRVNCRNEWARSDPDSQQPQPSPRELPPKPWWLHRLQAGETVFIPHLDQLPKAVRSSLQARGARSLVAIPIIIKGQLRGYVHLQWLHQTSTWQQHEVALLNFVGDLFANVFERQRADDKLRDSEKRFRLLAENATDLITLTTPGGTLTYLSPASAALLGYRPDELVGRKLLDLVHPEDREWRLGTSQGTEPRTRTFRLQHRDGHYLWVERISQDIVDPATGEVVEIQASTRNVTDRVEAEQKLLEANLELHTAYDATIEGWARALELRDKETNGHSQRVTALTVELGRALGLTDHELVVARRGALLHDMGKLGVPDSILLKPGKLTEDEWGIMRQHPSYAYEWLKHIHFLEPALAIPYSHHERWDGSGYPQGLAGEEIPLLARIFAVIDVFDALTSDRPYRDALPAKEALAYIQRQAGSHFDPAVVRTFVELMMASEPRDDEATSGDHVRTPAVAHER